MPYTTPADVWVSSSWADHKYRNPPSVEPGTDYATGYGTSIRMAGNGTVSAINRSNGGGTGRYVKVNLDDGRAVRYLHLSHIACYEGQWLAQGQLFAESGASGFGSDWGYGPHVHTTLLSSPWSNLRDSLDFENYVGAPAPPEPEPPAPPPPKKPWEIYEQELIDMLHMLTISDGDGKYGGGIIYALTGPDYWFELRTVAAANQLAARYGSAANVTYAEWDAAKAAAQGELGELPGGTPPKA